jgi:O-antigen ligase
MLAVVALPLLLKWHHPLLFLTWNMTAVVFFLPGRPQVWLAAAAMSLTLAMVQRALMRNQEWIHVPSVSLPLIYLAVVIYITGSIQDGGGFLFNVKALGATTVGSKAYYWILGGIIGFFAMISRPVPSNKVGLYVAFFFLGGLVNSIGSLLPYIPPSFWFVFSTFPVDMEAFTPTGEEQGINRFFGMTLAATGCYFYLFAKYGVQGILQWKALKRILIVLAMVAITAASGFRAFFILLALTFLLVFYFERLVKTRYTALIVITAALALVIAVPFARRLPLSVQRTLSFLPIDVDPVAAESARSSSEWRLQMWRELLPEIPNYLLLGKGIGVSGVEMEMTEELSQTRARIISAHQGALVVGNYHNGPLTVLIFFGLWGALGLMWFLIASIRALYHNYKFGDESLTKINTFLLAYFLARVIWFMTVFGDFRTDLAMFTGIIGLSLALNGGIRKGVRVHKFVQPLTLRKFRPLLRTTPPRSQPA